MTASAIPDVNACGVSTKSIVQPNERRLITCTRSSASAVPIGAAALSTVQIVKQAVLKVYEGGSHGLTITEQDRFNADLLDFINS